MAVPVSRDDGNDGAAFPFLGHASDREAPPASWPRRVGARLLDSLILLFPGYLLTDILVLRVMDLPVSTMADTDTGGVLLGDVVAAMMLFGLWLAYETHFIVRSGQTPGKMLLAIKVIPVHEDVVPMGVSPGSALRRAMLLNLPTAAVWGPLVLQFGLTMFFLVAVLWPLWDRPLRQGLHDKIVHTRVVHQSQPRFAYPSPDRYEQ
jgi:uncharacterized RDD family membrane protein YckC